MIDDKHSALLGFVRNATNMMGTSVQGSSSRIIAECFKLLDAERVGSVNGITKAYAERVGTVRSDVKLSAVGQRELIVAAAGSAIGNIASIARKVVELEAEHNSGKATAAKLEKPDVSDTLVDLALAALNRSEQPIPTMLLQRSERYRTAIARLPPELSNIEPHVHAKVQGSLVSPEVSSRLEMEAKALGFVREATQRAIDVVAGAAEMEKVELLKLFGKTWRLPGVHNPDAVVRLAALKAAEAAEADEPDEFQMLPAA